MEEQLRSALSHDESLGLSFGHWNVSCGCSYPWGGQPYTIFTDIYRQKGDAQTTTRFAHYSVNCHCPFLWFIDLCVSDSLLVLRCVWEMTDSELLKPTEFYNCHTTHSKAYRGVLALMQKKKKIALRPFWHQQVRLHFFHSQLEYSSFLSVTQKQCKRL